MLNNVDELLKFIDLKEPILRKECINNFSAGQIEEIVNNIIKGKINHYIAETANNIINDKVEPMVDAAIAEQKDLKESIKYIVRRYINSDEFKDKLEYSIRKFVFSKFEKKLFYMNE